MPGDRAEDPLASAAVDEIRSDMTVGLGTGRAASRVTRALARRGLEGIVCVATSHATESLARTLDLRVVPFASVAHVDVLVDGADEVDPRLRMLKGRGGAMTEEKRVARAASRCIYVVQARKLVARLGERAPLAIEARATQLASVEQELRALGLDPTLRRAEGGAEIWTDGGNPVLDAPLPTEIDLEVLAVALDGMVGVVGHGLFLDEADLVLVEDDLGRVSRRTRHDASAR